MSDIKLYYGDCIEVMKQIPDKSIDMILCDLPYGTTACKWDIVIPFDKLWEQYNRIIKDNRAIVLFGSEPFSSYLRLSNIKNYKYDWTWNKPRGTGFQIVKYKPLNSFENISVFSIKNKRIIYNPQMRPREKERVSKNKGTTRQMEISNGKAYNGNVALKEKFPITSLYFSNEDNKNKTHPTQKPVDLLEYLIKTYTNENMTVLDNCMGSGSTGIACIHTNRNFIGIELDNNYFNIAKDRIDKEQEIYNNRSKEV